MSDSDSDYSSSPNSRSGRKNRRQVKYLTPRKYRVRTRSALSNVFAVSPSPYESFSDDDDDDRSSQHSKEYTITPTKYAQAKVAARPTDDSSSREQSPIVRGEFILRSKPTDDTSFYNYKPKHLPKPVSYATTLTGHQARERAQNEIQAYEQQRSRSFTPIVPDDNKPSGDTTPRPANIDRDKYSPNPSNQQGSNVNPSLNIVPESDYGYSTPTKPTRATYTSVLYDQPRATYSTSSKLVYNFGPGESTETSVHEEEEEEEELFDEEPSEHTLVRMPLETVKEEPTLSEMDQEEFEQVTDVGTGTQIDVVAPSDEEGDQVDTYPVVNYPRSAATHQPSIVRYDETEEEEDPDTMEPLATRASEEEEDGESYRVDNRQRSENRREMPRGVGALVTRSPLRASESQRSYGSETTDDSRSRKPIPAGAEEAHPTAGAEEAHPTAGAEEVLEWLQEYLQQMQKRSVQRVAPLF